VLGGLLCLTLAAPTTACVPRNSAAAPAASPAAVSVAAAAPAAAGSAASGAAGPLGRVCSGPATAVAPESITPIATDSAPALPTAITDATGKRVTVSAADRVLAVGGSGGTAATIYALGLGNRLVGRDQATGLPELAGLPVVTRNGHELDSEAILKLNPDLVLMTPDIGPPQVKAQLEASGVPVVVVHDEPGAAAISPQIHEVAAVFGLSAVGDQLAQRVADQLDAVRQRAGSLIQGDPAQRLRMAFVYLRGTAGVYAWLGKGSGADDLIAALNGIDITDQEGVPSRTPLTAEAVAAADPQLLLVMTTGLQSVGGIEGLRNIAGLGQTAAGKAGCVVDMADTQILAFGPGYPAVLDALITAVYQHAAPA
jgi:iron complex transport system substrate-binding protein